ncbi:MAG: Xaa-Pro peptidase family protein [Fimbriimonadales bacterium]|nr:Xaa-Pro peptidase family protein [Fimbriimonadales bacterium]
MVPQHQGQAAGVNAGASASAPMPSSPNYAERRAKLRQAVFETKKPPGALLITSMANLYYLTGFTGSFGALLLTPNAERFLTGGIYATQAQYEVPDIQLVLNPTLKEFNETLAATAAELGVSVLGVESSTSVAGLKALRKAAHKAGIRVEPVGMPVDKLRRVKDGFEIARLRAAAALADVTFEHIQRLFQPEVAEWDIAMEIDFYIRRQEAYPAFDTIVVSGERTALPHGKPTERRLQKGDFVTLDFGAKLNGYCSDLTRTVVIGKASTEQRKLYYAVLEALQRSIDAIRPGKRGKQIDALARKVLDRHGLAEYFGHGLGHSLGILVHDGSGLSFRDKQPLEAGMVLTVEPGVYVPDFGGVRIEQDVLVTESGCEPLTHAPVDLLECEW